MTISVENYVLVEDETVLSLQFVSVADLVLKVQEHNKTTADKISINKKYAALRFNHSNALIPLTTYINKTPISIEVMKTLALHGYIVVEKKLLFILDVEKQTLRGLTSASSGDVINAVLALNGTQISRADKNSWLDQLEGSHEGDAWRSPVSMRVELYDYQKKGFNWIKSMFRSQSGVLLADDMGLGKTAQVLAFLTDGFSKGVLRRTLIVVPNSLLANWSREISKFTEGFKPYIHWGSDRVGFPQQLENHSIVITTYATVSNDESLFDELKFDVLVCDEASLLKNPESKRAKAINALNYRFSIAITGTPFENSLMDLWSLTNIVSKNFLGTYESFRSRYHGVKLDEISVLDIKALESSVNEIMLRRLKSEVLDDLPDKIDIYIALTPNDSETFIYNHLIDEIKASSDGSALALISHLRKFTAHPYLYGNDILSRRFSEMREASAKFNHLSKIIESVIFAGEKALVFANHKDLLEGMRQEFAQQFRIPCFKIDGTVSVAERQSVIDAFEAAKGSSVLFLNPITAGMGLNITAANHVVHFSRQWNPALEQQATARSFRNGQTKSVNAYYLFYANTIEEVIHERLNIKQNLSSSIITPSVDQEVDALYLELIKEL
uniref:DEAD/DEAH box helicase n=1 Tax=Yoonia sp. TaxID=2212373 RepID=UPI0040476B36